MLFAEILILSLQIYIYNKTYKFKINLISINCILWILLLFLNRCYFSADTNGEFFIVIGCTIFNFSHFIARQIAIINTKQTKVVWINYDLKRVSVIIKFLFVFEILRVLLSFYAVIKIAGSFTYFFLNNTDVRNKYLARQESILFEIFYNLVNYLAYTGLIIVSLYLGQSYKNNLKVEFNKKLFFLFWILLEVIAGLITMSKMGLFASVIIFVTGFYYSIGERKYQRKFVEKIIPMLVMFLSIYLILIGMQRNYANDSKGLVLKVFEKATEYFVLPVQAFYRLLSGTLNITSNGKHFSFIKINEVSTNVFTAFGIFYLDYGILGILIAPAILGFLSGYIIRFRNNSLSAIAFYAFYIMGVIFSFYNVMQKQKIYLLVPIFILILQKIFLEKYIRGAKHDFSLLLRYRNV